MCNTLSQKLHQKIFDEWQSKLSQFRAILSDAPVEVVEPEEDYDISNHPDSDEMSFQSRRDDFAQQSILPPGWITYLLCRLSSSTAAL